MVEVGSSGIYQTASISFSLEDKYRVEYTTPTKYENAIEDILVTDILGATPANIADAVWDELASAHTVAGSFSELLKRIDGLVQDNYKIENQSYDKSHNLIGADVKIYPSKTDLENDTNLKYQYRMDAVFNKLNQLTGYTMKRIT
jgi:hypothetical protein